MKPINDVTGIIVDSAYKLHKQLGPGLLESVYEALLAQQLQINGLQVERQKAITFEIVNNYMGHLPRTKL